MSQSGEYTLIFWHMCMKNISSSYISITTHTKWVNFNTQGKDRSEHSLLHPLGPVRALAAEMRIPQPLLSAFISVVMFEGEWEDQMLNPGDYYGKDEEAQSDNASSWKLLFVVAFQSYLHFFPCTKIILLCTHEWGSWASILWRVWHSLHTATSKSACRLVARAGKGLRIFGQIARKSVPTMSIGGNAGLFIMHYSRMARAARYHAVRSISDNSTGTKWNRLSIFTLEKSSFF